MGPKQPSPEDQERMAKAKLYEAQAFKAQMEAMGEQHHLQDHMAEAHQNAANAARQGGYADAKSAEELRQLLRKGQRQEAMDALKRQQQQSRNQQADIKTGVDLVKGLDATLFNTNARNSSGAK